MSIHFLCLQWLGLVLYLDWRCLPVSIGLYRWMKFVLLLFVLGQSTFCTSGILMLWGHVNIGYFCQLLPKSCCFIAFKMFFLEFKRWCLQNDIKLLNMSLKFPFSSPFQCLKYHRVKQTEGHDAIEWKMGELVLRGRGNFQWSSFQTTPQWMLLSTVDVAFPSQF